MIVCLLTSERKSKRAKGVLLSKGMQVSLEKIHGT